MDSDGQNWKAMDMILQSMDKGKTAIEYHEQRWKLMDSDRQ